MDMTYERPTPADLECIRAQLQRAPRGVLGVAVRCRYGKPQVIVSHPLRLDGRPAPEATADDVLQAKRVEVFPTLFWLTCPYVNRGVGRLESVGWITRLKDEVGADDSLAAELLDAHRTAAALRTSLVSEPVLNALAEHYPGQFRVLTETGVAGMSFQSHADDLGIKCLHAHLADYLARGGNPVGRRVWGLLAAHSEDPRGLGHCFAAASCACPGVTVPERVISVMDVGSNTVRLLVGRLAQGKASDGLGGSGGSGASGGRLEVLHRNLVTTRIGAGVSTHGQIEPDAAEKTLTALKQFRSEAERYGAAEPICVGTSALREAANAAEFLVRAWEEAGVAVRVISGEEEAALSFEGAMVGLWDMGGDDTSDEAGAKVGALDNVIVIDIGGGSTELIWRDTIDSPVATLSIPMGVVRLRQQVHGDDLAAIEAMRDRVRPLLRGALADTPLAHADGSVDDGDASECRIETPNSARSRLVAVGGTATSIGAMALQLEEYDPAKVTGVRLTVEDLQRWIERLMALSESERRKIPGLHPERADVILPGLVILQTALDLLADSGWIAREVTVCDSDLMHALLLREYTHQL